MKKGKLLNSELSSVISKMGHTDGLVVGDCGLPIDESVKRIDLALTHNVPTFLQTLEVILEELYVEEVILANEIEIYNTKLLVELKRKFNNIKFVSHEEFKQLTKTTKAVVRTGECTPYANIILKSGVEF